jgi:hypothetical protein
MMKGMVRRTSFVLLAVVVLLAGWEPSPSFPVYTGDPEALR